MNTPATALSSINRVQAWSRRFRWFTWILLGLVILAAISQIAWNLLRVARAEAPIHEVLTTSLFLQAAWIGGLWLVQHILRRFERGEILVEPTARGLRQLGVWVALTAAFFFLPALLGRLLDGGSSLVQRLMDATSLLLSTPGVTILAGVFLVMLGWVLEEAVDLRNKEDLTI